MYKKSFKLQTYLIGSKVISEKGGVFFFFFLLGF